VATTPPPSLKATCERVLYRSSFSAPPLRDSVSDGYRVKPAFQLFPTKKLIKDLISRSRDQVAGSRSPSTARRRRLLGKRFGTPQVFAVTGRYMSGPELWRDVWSGRSMAVWAAREEQLLIAMTPRWLSVRGRCALSADFGCAKWFSRDCGSDWLGASPSSYRRRWEQSRARGSIRASARRRARSGFAVGSGPVERGARTA
jgi:hypothetical protein